MNSSYIQIFENEEIEVHSIEEYAGKRERKKKCSKANIQDM